MLRKSVAVLALAASCVMTGAPPTMAGTRHQAASENSPWFDTNYNPADSRANLTETALNPATVTKVTYLRSIASPVIPPGGACPGDIVAPVLVGGDLYAVTDDLLSKYDAATGRLIWRRTPDPAFTHDYESLSVSNGLVVVGASDCTSVSEPPGKLWAYNATTGALVWTTSMPGAGPLGEATVPGSFVLAGGADSGGNDVAVFNLSSGKVIWHSGGCGFTGALVVGGLVISDGCDSQGNPTLQAWTLAAGSVVWTQDGDWTLWRGDLGGAGGTHLYATNPAGSVVDLNPRTGTVEYTLSGAVNVLAVDRSRVYATCGGNGTFVCGYNISTGAQEWKNTQPRVTTIAAEADGVLYTGPAGSALNAATGKIIAQIWGSSLYNFVTAMAVGDGRIAVVGDPRVLDLYGLPGS